MGGRSFAFVLGLVFSLGGCCLEISGSGTGVSPSGSGSTASSGSTTGSDDGGPITTMLWIGGAGAIDPAALPSSGNAPFAETCPSPPSTSSAGIGGAAVIDGAGNLWAQAFPNTAVYVWTPEQLAQSCASAAPALTFNFSYSFSAMAFDSEGNLWGANPREQGDGLIAGYRSADLATSGSPSPAWILTGNCASLDSLCTPIGLAFDADGYLWVGDTIGLQAFSQLRRTGSNDGGPEGTGPLSDFHITTPCEAFELDAGTPGGACPPVSGFEDLAFDAAGNVWAIFDQGSKYLLAYSHAQLLDAQKDDQSPPALDYEFYDGTLLLNGLPAGKTASLAFDADGNLWIGLPGMGLDVGPPNLIRLPRESLDGGAFLPVLLPVPGVPDVAVNVPPYATLSLAFSPIPPGLPIQP